MLLYNVVRTHVQPWVRGHPLTAMAMFAKGGEALGDIVMYRVGRRHCRLVAGSHASRAKIIRGIDWATVLLNASCLMAAWHTAVLGLPNSG